MRKLICGLFLTAATAGACLCAPATATAIGWDDCLAWGGVVAYQYVDGHNAFCLCTLDDKIGHHRLGVFGGPPDYWTGPPVHCMGLSPGGGASAILRR